MLNACKLRRFMALMVDLLLVEIINLSISPIAPIKTIVIDLYVIKYRFVNLDFLILFLVYSTIFIFINNGRTPGKTFLGIVYETKRRYTNRFYIFVRELIKIALFPIFIISVLLFVFREDGKSLHDLIMSTKVTCNHPIQVFVGRQNI